MVNPARWLWSVRKRPTIASGFSSRTFFSGVVSSLSACSVMSAKLDVLARDVVDAERMIGGVDVADDVRRLFVALVGVDHQRLNGCRIDDPGDQRDHGPQRGRDNGNAPRVGAQGGEEQTGDQERDQRQQDDGRQLRLGGRVQQTANEPARVCGQFVAGEPVVAGLHDRQRGEQHGDVSLGRPANLRPWRLDDDATAEHVSGDDEQGDEHERGEQPVEHEGDERQVGTCRSRRRG